MKIAVIGAGFTGLAAALSLTCSGHQVEVFESETRPGGLAVGFKAPGWDWPLEKHYHHLFVSDWSIRHLAKNIGTHISFSRPKTSTLHQGQIFQLDSPLSLLAFDHLSFASRIRTGIGLGLLKYSPFWRPLENITAKQYIIQTMGTASWKVVWEPLFRGKFAHQADQISASWFWARIFKRSTYLGYPDGGFQALAENLADKCVYQGVKIHYSTPVSKIFVKFNKPAVIVSGLASAYDAVICTQPSPVFTKLAPDLPKKYSEFLTSARGIGAVNLILSLKNQFLTDGTYWLNINDRKYPFLALVEHTNFLDKRHYNSEHLLYLGNYLSANHIYFSLSSDQLLTKFGPYLRQINPDFNLSWVTKSWVWKAPFAQPLVTRNYSNMIPKFTTPLPGVYLANLQQVYPWDRGTNYAVQLGERIAHEIAG